MRVANDGKVVVNLNGQREQGRVEYGMEAKESQMQRALWFKQCLLNIPAELGKCGVTTDEIAFPYQVSSPLLHSGILTVRHDQLSSSNH